MEKNSIDKFIAFIQEEKIPLYVRNARINRFLHHLTQTLIVVFAATTPIVAALEKGKNNGTFEFTIIISASLAILEGISRLFRFKDIWIRYRKTSNLLINELREFESKSGEYSQGEGIELLFKKNVEEIIKNEQIEWLNSVNR